MRFAMRVSLRRAEGALVRLLGLVGRRGFDVVDVAARPAAGDELLDVVLTLEGDRARDVLARQIARLVDVVHVELGTEGAAWTR